MQASYLQGVTPKGHKEATGTLQQPLTFFSLFFMSISILSEAKPGYPYYTYSTLCPKLLNPEVALQDKTQGRKALMSTSVTSKTPLPLLGF